MTQNHSIQLLFEQSTEIYLHYFVECAAQVAKIEIVLIQTIHDIFYEIEKVNVTHLEHFEKGKPSCRVLASPYKGK